MYCLVDSPSSPLPHIRTIASESITSQDIPCVTGTHEGPVSVGTDVLTASIIHQTLIHISCMKRNSVDLTVADTITMYLLPSVWRV